MPPDVKARRELAMMCHLYGLKPWEVGRLTASQLQALLGESNWILYMRDRAMRDYAFMKIDQKKLAEADLSEPPDPVTVKARERFLASYSLPEYRTKRPTRLAAKEFLHALDKGRVPPWVLAVAPPINELKELI